jgi:hypothetical protein
MNTVLLEQEETLPNDKAAERRPDSNPGKNEA